MYSGFTVKNVSIVGALFTPIQLQTTIYTSVHTKEVLRFVLSAKNAAFKHCALNWQENMRKAEWTYFTLGLLQTGVSLRG